MGLGKVMTLREFETMEKVLLSVENGLEDRELLYPYYRFQEAGYKVDILGLQAEVAYKGEYGLTKVRLYPHRMSILKTTWP